MVNLGSWILSYLLNSLWQIPLLFAAAWIVARILRPHGVRAEHPVWVAALVLQTVLPAMSAFSWKWPALEFWRADRILGDSVSIAMGAGAAGSSSTGFLPSAITAAYIAVTFYFAARFFWRLVNLSALRRGSAALALAAEPARFWSQCSRTFGVRNASIAIASGVSGPVTLGIRRPLLLVPAGLLDALQPADLQTVIAHEFAHMQRNDFSKNLLYELLAFPVGYHPLLWLTRARIMQSREMICDQMAAAISGKPQYARSLLRLASLLLAGSASTTPHTIGIFDANVFERRLMNLTEKHQEVTTVRRLTHWTAAIALGLATCATALAWGVHVEAAPMPPVNHASKAPARLTVSPQQMAGHVLTKAAPIYPPAAKKAKIQGKVVLSAVIGNHGTVEAVRVLSGPAELQQSALDAVRQWTYKPYVVNGQPVEVETTIAIIYSLAG